MSRRVQHNKDNFSQGDTSDGPSSTSICCCLAAFGTAAICFLIGTFLFFLKVYDSTDVYIEFSPGFIAGVYSGITTLYMIIGLGFVCYDSALRLRAKRLLQEIPKVSFPGKKAIDKNSVNQERRTSTTEVRHRRNLASNTLESPREQDLQRDNVLSREENGQRIDMPSRNGDPYRDNKLNIIAQRHFNEIARLSLENKLIRFPSLIPQNSSTGDEQRFSSSAVQQRMEAEEFSSGNLQRDLSQKGNLIDSSALRTKVTVSPCRREQLPVIYEGIPYQNTERVCTVQPVGLQSHNTDRRRRHRRQRSNRESFRYQGISTVPTTSARNVHSYANFENEFAEPQIRQSQRTIAF